MKQIGHTKKKTHNTATDKKKTNGTIFVCAKQSKANKQNKTLGRITNFSAAICDQSRSHRSLRHSGAARELERKGRKRKNQ